jgi:hypothetical protein
MKSTGYISEECGPLFFVPIPLIFSHTFSHTVGLAGAVNPVVLRLIGMRKSQLTLNEQTSLSGG